MAFICALSNETPQEPVISTRSGRIFEKRLIVKYITEFHKDPVTDDELTEEMLVPVKNPPVFTKPRPDGVLSIPDLLNTFRDEWDACVLNNYRLQQQLMTTKQELSHALYQFDASARALARLSEKYEELREKIASRPIQESNNHTSNDVTMDMPPPKRIRFEKIPMDQDDGEPPKLNDDRDNEELYNNTLVPESEERAKTLMSERKERMKNAPPGLVPANQIRECNIIKDFPLPHSSSTKGILCMDICTTNSNKLVTGGRDSNVLIFDKDKEQVTHTLKGHKKRINKVVYHPNEKTIISGSSDKTVRVWSIEDGSSISIAQQGEINDISLHATGDYILAASYENWSIANITSGRVLKSYSGLETSERYTKVQFHPDGQLFATGTSKQLDIWDVKTPNQDSSKVVRGDDISAMTFSENGYYLASASDFNHRVSIWDLRKIGAKVKVFDLPDDYIIRDLSFDITGTYLAVCGSDVRVYLCKKQGSQIARWETVKTLEDDNDQVISSVRFANDCKFIGCAYEDRNILKLYVP